MKTCTKCKTTKPFEWFSKNPKLSDGRNSWCKECTNVQSRERARNKSLIKAKAREKKLNSVVVTIAVAAELNRREAVRKDLVFWKRYHQSSPPSAQAIKQFLDWANR